MKALISIFILLAISSFGFSQDGGDAKKFKVTFGPPYEIPKKYADYGFIGNEEDGIIQVSLKPGKELVLQRFDPTKLTIAKETRIDITTLPPDFQLELFREISGDAFIFYSVWDKPRKKEQLFVQQIDVKKGALTGKPRMLIEAEQMSGTLVATGFYQFSSMDKYTFEFSGDTSHMVITYKLRPAQKNNAVNKDVVGFYVFDNNVQKVWGKEFTMPYTEEMMGIKDYAVDRRGNAYLLAKVYDDKRKESKDDAPNYHYELLKATGEAKSLQPIAVKLQDKFINEIYINQDFSGNFVLVGYYRNKVKSAGTEGAFVFKVDENGKVSNFHKGYYEFPVEILQQYEKGLAQAKLEKADKKDKAEAFKVDFRGMTIFDDNSMLILGEQYYIVTRTYTSSNGKTYTTYTYYYNDIYLMKINGNGEMAWTRKIPKQQQGKNGRGNMSFKYMYYNGNSYFFYLDNIKNLNLRDDQPPAVHMDGVGGFLTVYKIDNDGNYSKGKLFDSKEKKVVVWPRDMDRLSPTSLFGRAFGDDKKSRIMRIALQP